MLPVDFQNRMKQMLGDEYDDFIASYDKPQFHGIRINSLKTTMSTFTNNFKYNFIPVPWAEDGLYYGDDIKPGKHP